MDSIYEKWLPAAYRIGLDLDLFWRLNPRRMEPFLRMYENKRTEELREKREFNNQLAYLTGRYVQAAIASCLSKGCEYPKQPYDLRSAEEIAAWQATPEYQEQQRLILLTKMRQDERRKRREEARIKAREAKEVK